MKVCSILAAAGVLMAAGSAMGQIEVIYTKKAGHPKAVVPGAQDLSGNPATTEFRALEDLMMSPDGTRWVIKGRTQLGTDLETILLMGSGSSGTRFYQEGNLAPGGGADERFDFFGTAQGAGRFDEMNRFAFAARIRNMATGSTAATNGQRVFMWDGTTLTVAQKQNDPLTGLMDLAPNPSGDETVGNSVGSVHLLNDGRIGTQDSTINVIHTSRRPAIFYDRAAFHQTAVTTFTGLDTNPVTWGTIDANTFYTTPDGAHWMAQGRGSTQVFPQTVLVRDGVAVLQTGSPIGTTSVLVDGIFDSRLMPNGRWYARGDVIGDNDWAVSNGVLIAQTGDPITTGATENWGAVFQAFGGDSAGKWVLAGTTNDPDPSRNEVLVYNGTQVIAREGDAIDLDGNGSFDDDAFLGRGNNTLTVFEPNDLFLTDDGYIYFFANLRNGAGVDLNSSPSFGTPQAFMRVRVSVPCPADFNGVGGLTVQDIFDFLAAYFSNSLTADFNNSGSVTVQDIFDFLAAYFAGCP